MKKIIDYFKNFNKEKKLENFSIIFLILAFLLGYIGLSILAIIVEGCFYLAPDIVEGLGEANFSAIHLFTTYLLLTIIVIIISISYKPLTDALKKQIKDKPALIEGLSFGAIALALSMGYSVISSMLFPHDSNNNQQGIELAFEAQPLLIAISVSVFAPICEEFSYRIGLLGACSKKSNIVGFLVSMLIFALIHFDFMAEDIVNELINLPGYLIGGIVLACAYFKRGNIFTSVIAHSVYNFCQTLLMILGAILA